MLNASFVRLTAVAVLILTIITAGSSFITASAAHFPAPTNVLCNTAGDLVSATWDDIGAPKYGGDFIATYADGSVLEFDFSAFTNSISTTLGDLTVDLDGDGEATDLPVAVSISVKGMHPGRGQGPQNNAKSAPVDCGI